MALSRAQREAKERERREAEWRANEERVRKQGDLFSALPRGPARTALLEGMADRIIDLYNNCKYAEGDELLQFLPNEYAYRFLDWYFDDEDRSQPFPTEAPPGEDEVTQQGQIQGEPQEPVWANGKFEAMITTHGLEDGQ